MTANEQAAITRALLDARAALYVAAVALRRPAGKGRSRRSKRASELDDYARMLAAWIQTGEPDGYE